MTGRSGWSRAVVDARACLASCRAGRDRSKDRRWILERAPVVQLPWSRRYRSVTGFPRRGHRHGRGCGTPGAARARGALPGAVFLAICFDAPRLSGSKTPGGADTRDRHTNHTNRTPSKPTHPPLFGMLFLLCIGNKFLCSPSTFVTLWFLFRRAHLASRCPHVLGRRDSLFHARALPLMLTHVHRPPFCFVQPGLLGIGSTVRPYDLRTLLAAGVCAARRAPSTHAMFGGSTCPAP